MLPNRSLLRHLESESVHVLREVAAECRAPVFLYSIGKDSSVLLRLMQKAFHPAPVPFPLLHVDTGWKFKAMIAHRDRTARELGLRLVVHTNRTAQQAGVNPFDHPHYTHAMKTEALRAALDAGGWDAAIGGARRDEERSRAKERVFSLRAPGHAWDPKRQRPEFWRLWNTRLSKGETLRVFPLSNWTEADVWAYVVQEAIPVVPLYFAAPRPVVERDGTLVMVDDDRMRLRPGEVPQVRRVRFRSLGCYPLSGAVPSGAATPEDVLEETLAARTSERGGRLIDRDEGDSMERKKREGYF